MLSQSQQNTKIKIANRHVKIVPMAFIIVKMVAAAALRAQEGSFRMKMQRQVAKDAPLANIRVRMPKRAANHVPQASSKMKMPMPVANLILLEANNTVCKNNLLHTIYILRTTIKII